MRDRAAQNKPPRFDARDLVDLGSGPGLHQFVDRAAKRAGVAEKRRDVPEHDAWFWVIGNRADRVPEVEGHEWLTRCMIASSFFISSGSRAGGEVSKA